MSKERLSKLQRATLQVLKIMDEDKTELFKKLDKEGCPAETEISDSYFQPLRSLTTFPFVHISGVKEATWEWMKDMGYKGKDNFDCSFSRSIRNLVEKGFLEDRRVGWSGRHVESVKRTEKAMGLDYP